METYSITIYILYGNQTYSLDIPSLFTVRQLKEVLSEQLHIEFDNLVVSCQTVILDNDKTLSYYGIQTDSCIEVIENAYQNSQETDLALLEFSTWLDNLSHDYEDAMGFVRHVDFVINKVQENLNNKFSLAVIDDAMSYIERCSDHVVKLEKTVEVLSGKYAYLQNSFIKFYNTLQESKKQQIALNKKIKEMGLHEGEEHRIEYDPTFRQSLPPSVPSSEKELSPIKEYLQQLDTIVVDNEVRASRRISIESRFQLHLTEPPKLLRSIVKVDDNGVVIKEHEKEFDGEDESDAAEYQALQEENWKQLRRIDGYRISQEMEDEEGMKRYEAHDKNSAFAILNQLEKQKNTSQRIASLDLSYSGIGNEGFTELVNIFINNSTLELFELYLAGNNLGLNQINYLINQLHLGLLNQTKNTIFQKLRILDLNDNPLGSEGVNQLFVFFKNDCFPELRQVFLINCRFTTEIASGLLSIHLHENNLVNFVTGATQAALMTKVEKQTVEKLQKQIEKGSLRNVEIEGTISDMCLQLYFNFVLTSAVNTVEKIALKDVDLGGNVFVIVLRILYRYVSYNRCDNLTSLSFIRCNLDNTHVPLLINFLRLIGDKKLHSFNYLNLEGNKITFDGFKQLEATIEYVRKQGLVLDWSITRDAVGRFYP